MKTNIEDDLPLSVLRDQMLKSEKPYFKTTTYELVKYKRSHVFKCLQCAHTETSQKRINCHFPESHGLLECPTCGKRCNTISALKNHAYDHSDKSHKHACKDCDHAFPFQSQLKSHRKVHLVALEHHCIHCNKSYKSSGELVKHQSVHSGKKWKCQHPDCKYECFDPRNLCVHMHSHGKNT